MSTRSRRALDLISIAIALGIVIITVVYFYRNPDIYDQARNKIPFFTSSNSEADHNKQPTASTPTANNLEQLKDKDNPANKTVDTNKDNAKSKTVSKLHGQITAYRIVTGNFPEASIGGWAGFVNWSKHPESLKDPYTGTVYKFTSSDPDYGQIQYVLSAICDYKTNSFIEKKSPNIYAFRLKFSTGIKCSSSI